MKRLLPACALALLCCHPSSPSRAPAPSLQASPASTPSWADLRRAARAARVAHDYAAYHAALAELYDRSGSAVVVYELAIASALLEKREDALGWLRRYAAMGLAEDATPAPVLDSVRRDPSFAALRTQMEENVRPVAHAVPALPLPADDLITEDIAYDPRTRTFFVSSVRRRKVLAVDERGAARDFVAGDPELGSACGLAIHGDRLWVASAELPPMAGYRREGPHPTALLAYDLATGRRLERIALPAGAGEHALTDLAIDARGTVFASDAIGGAVYVLAAGAYDLEPLCAPGTFVSPQTPALTDDGKALLVPDYAKGIARVDLASRAVTWLSHPNVAVEGIDGLYSVGTSLYAVQNGTLPVRIVRLALDAARTSIVGDAVLEQRTPGLGEPTHGVLVGDSFFFLANAGWTRVGEDGAPLPDAPPDAPAIWRLAAPLPRDR